jgi:hypothetical protein
LEELVGREGERESGCEEERIRSCGFGWRIHCGVEVTESSTNKQHTLCVQKAVPYYIYYTIHTKSL